MRKGVIYEIVDRQSPSLIVGWIRDGVFFNATQMPPFYDGKVTGNELRSRPETGNVVLATIDGLVMSRNGGGRVFDLVPRS